MKNIDEKRYETAKTNNVKTSDDAFLTNARFFLL